MKQNNLDIINTLSDVYNEPKCELNFSNNYELLVAVILSAQCTDKRVNQVTAKLFEKFNTPEKMIKLSQEELEDKIRSCGFFHNKAKHILEMSRELIEKYNGIVPSNKESLKNLAGVGEKTANVVLAVGFNIPAIAVDTHVFRVSNRLGLANAESVEKTQQQLEKILPKNKWINMHYMLVLHGRYVCKSQKPKCGECKLQKFCNFYKSK